MTENNFNELKEKNSALVDPTKGNFEESHVEFSQKIFGLNNGLYNKEYPDHFWMGIVEDFYVYNPIGEHGSGQPITSQFGNRLGKSQGSENFYYDRIKLNDKEHKSEDIFLELILIKFTKP